MKCLSMRPNTPNPRTLTTHDPLLRQSHERIFPSRLPCGFIRAIHPSGICESCQRLTTLWWSTSGTLLFLPSHPRAGARKVTRLACSIAAPVPARHARPATRSRNRAPRSARAGLGSSPHATSSHRTDPARRDFFRASRSRFSRLLCLVATARTTSWS